ncbi:hypothetical protein AURDEDRAFT_168013 [Auricularia subglabra TFB-10046 SS5]|nr:hypothetical protein AURDEDRAFT_168013 [Auricularia subglabra TFB-10046 SS5]
MKRSDRSQITKRKNAPPQLMLNGISSFGCAEEADKRARRRMPRITDTNPDLCPQIMVLQLEGSKMHTLDTSDQGQRSGSWNALLSALGPSSGIGTPPSRFTRADDDTDVSEPTPSTHQSPLSSASSEISLSPEPSSGHHSDPATYVRTPHHSTFKSSLGLVDLRGHTALPSYLRSHHDNRESVVGPATPLDLGAGQKSLPGPVNGQLPPLWALQRQSIGVDEAAAYRRDALVSLPTNIPKSRDEPVTRPHPAAKSAPSPSLSPTTSQSSVLPSNSDSEMSTPASGRRSFFETVLGPSTAREQGDDDGAMLVDSEPLPSPRPRSAPARTVSSSAKARGSLSFRTGPFVTRTYKVVPATARPPRRERVSDPTVKPFACRHCTRRYQTEAQRDAHLEKHKYPCNICDAVLTDLSTLKAHKDRHAGLRSYTCDCAWQGSDEPCGKAFVTFGDLYQHMRQTHGVVPKSQGETTIVKKSAAKL